MRLIVAIVAVALTCSNAKAESLEERWAHVSLGMSKIQLTDTMGVVHYGEGVTLLGVRYERLVWWNPSSLTTGSINRFFVAHLIQGIVVIATTCKRPNCEQAR